MCFSDFDKLSNVPNAEKLHASAGLAFPPPKFAGISIPSVSPAAAPVPNLPPAVAYAISAEEV